MRLKQWGTVLLAAVLLSLCACHTKTRETAVQMQPQPNQTVLRTDLSGELDTGLSEPPVLQEESDNPIENTHIPADGIYEEQPDNPVPLPEEPVGDATDEPEPDTPETEPEDPPPDEVGAEPAAPGEDDAELPEEPGQPEQPPSAAVVLPAVPIDGEGTTQPVPPAEPAAPGKEDGQPADEPPADVPVQGNDLQTEQTDEQPEKEQSGPAEETAEETAEEADTGKPSEAAVSGTEEQPQAEGEKTDTELETYENPEQLEPAESEQFSVGSAKATDEPEHDKDLTQNSGSGWAFAFFAAMLVIAAEGAYIFLQRKQSRMRHKKAQVSTTQAPQTQSILPLAAVDGTVSRVAVGKIHAQGERESQQDSFSVSSDAMQPDGILAVVADGMGGLSDGDKVSQTIVSSVMHAFVSGDNTDAPRLPALLASAKLAVDRLLGPDGLRKSGSTVVMGLLHNGLFTYLSVGDSRICLYRNGELHQLSRSHTYAHQLMIQAINGEKTFAQIAADPKAGCVTSYIGMGEVKYIDIPPAPIKAHPGDKFILMSDGVFNALTEQELCAALNMDAEEAAKEIDRWIQKKHYRNQDNYTAVILQCCADAE